MFKASHSYACLALVAAVALVAGGTVAQAEMVKMKAPLSASTEVPPNSSKGSGNSDFTYDTSSKKLQYTVTYKDTSGPVTAGHIHGPAAPGANAGVVVPFQNAGTSPVKGEATLTDAQAADLMAGRYYVNLHTDANKGGELRGQITK
ncbi:MAG TPA: CHRD domain-containing protein [Alphaproteobacteria bacterium]